MISTTGAQLLPPQALRVLQNRLLPLATILTPNIPEARLLLADAGRRHFPVECADDLEAMAKEMVRALGVKWVLVKGGHCPFRRGDGKAAGDGEGEIVVDVLAGGDNGDEVVRVQTDFCRSRNTHGTGCSLACEYPFFAPSAVTDVRLAAAIASNLAKGMDVPAAVRAACRYVEVGIKTAPGLGGGNGPLNHFHSVYILPFSPYDSAPAFGACGWLILVSGATSSSISWSGLMSHLSGTGMSTTRLCWPWETRRCRWSRSRAT